MLGPRMTALAKQVPLGARVADIGTDHGLLPFYLVKNQIAIKVIATDISEASLQKARDLCRDENLEDIIETRLGPGLKAIDPGEVDTIIIAGMGGVLIRDILKEGDGVLKSTSKLILQPMNAQGETRKWLAQNGWALTHEVLAKENGHIYEIMVGEPGCQKVRDPIQYDIGFKLIENRDPLFIEFIEKKIAKTWKIIEELKTQETENAKMATKEFEDRLRKYEEAYRWFLQ